MNLSERLLRIICGEERSLSASVFRTAARVIEPIYGAAVDWRNRRFDRKYARNEISHADAPVVSVGNLTLGGTGKTPLVLWIAEQLLAQNKRVAVLSRGYKSAEQRSALNDEGREMKRRLPELILLQHPDRVALARRAVSEFHAECLLLDDGFQHRRLFRDVDVVVIDATAPFGATGRLFPNGTLREPRESLKRADAVVFTHATKVLEAQKKDILAQISAIPGRKPELIVAETRHAPEAFVVAGSAEGHSDETRLPLDAFRGARVGVFCGVGNPEAFLNTLAEVGIDPGNRVKRYPDHCAFDARSVEALEAWSRSERLDALLCTEKDIVKFDTTLPSVPLAALRIRLEFLASEEAFREKVLSTLKGNLV
ncbi:MAG: tetraacyldisaccharide 4'-kinase [Planctomycetia bacterium]|nr:tetraacyldisaccharide 4'-kinase [Planctomycetia bacterium]